ncbi:uncharacterized protein L199_008419 [Kwoniella botswanensis]|uniref:uncharacterized protein n=1 Tax=Kwoniella botswanensis TaxID=1268659 RepID=UPI00315DEEDE
MSSSTTFILSSSSSTPLASSPSLALLPFSLGGNSSPHATNSAPLSNYFKPRPIPSSSRGSTSTSTIASFRGRTVVGQYIDIPKGWKGVILGTGKRPDKGGLLDVASSSASHSDSSNVAKAKEEDVDMVTEEEGMDSDLSLRRTTRQNPQRRRGPSAGTGQVALSKPKIRGNNNTARQNKKRYRLDSDDEEDDDENGQESTIKEERLIRTPNKRSKLSYTTPQKGQPRGEVVVPDIVIQEATPLKYPLPTPKKRLNGRRSSPSPDPHGKRGLPQVTESMEWVEEQIIPKIEEVKEDEDEQDSRSQSQSQSIISNELKEDISTTTSVESNEDLKIDEKEQEEEENLIPSPSTEDDPPTFNTEIKTETEKPAQKTIDNSNIDNSSTEKIDHDGGHQEGEYDGPMRILRPISTFDGFMLYTPDDPLIGFRSDELDESQNQTPTQNGDEQITSTDNENGTNGTNNPDVKILDTGGKEKDSDGTIQVRKSWWRSGGGGEGGDEFIRGLGEWLGLVEILNQPVYLDGLEEEEDEDED